MKFCLVIIIIALLGGVTVLIPSTVHAQLNGRTGTADLFKLKPLFNWFSTLKPQPKPESISEEDAFKAEDALIAWQPYAGEASELLGFVGLETLQRLRGSPVAIQPNLILQSAYLEYTEGLKKVTPEDRKEFVKRHQELIVNPAELKGSEVRERFLSLGFKPFKVEDFRLPSTVQKTVLYQKIAPELGDIFVFYQQDKNAFGIVSIRKDRVVWKMLSPVHVKTDEKGGITVSSPSPLVDLGYFIKNVKPANYRLANHETAGKGVAR